MKHLKFPYHPVQTSYFADGHGEEEQKNHQFLFSNKYFGELKHQSQLWIQFTVRELMIFFNEGKIPSEIVYKFGIKNIYNESKGHI